MTLEPPRVEETSFLTLHYRLCGPDGKDIVNTFDDKPATLSMGTQELAPALQSRLIGMVEGQQASFHLPAGEAYGERQAHMQQWVARKLLSQLGDPLESYQEGDVVQFPTPDGQGSYAGVARAVEADRVLFDFNHPLAGQAVQFDVKIIGVL